MRNIFLLIFIWASLVSHAQFIVNPYVYDVNQLIGPNTSMNLSFNMLSSMMRGVLPDTDVTTDGHAVSLAYDQTQNGLIVRGVGGSGTYPILGSDGTRNNYIDFDGASDFLTVQTSISFFNSFWSAVPRGTILIWFRLDGGDAASQCILCSTGAPGTAAGLQILRTSANKINARGATSSAITWTVTSTDDITTSDGWVGMIVSINGTGASAGRLILMDSGGTIFNDQTFTVAAGTTINSVYNMVIGARPTSSSTYDVYFNGAVSSIIVENFPVTDALINQFKVHNPIRTSEEFTPIVQYLMDADNNSLFFNNSAGTVVCSDGDVIRVARGQIAGNLSTIFSSLRRQWSASSDATAPTYQTNELNGHSVLQYDGVDDNLTLTAMPTTLFEEQAGKLTFFLVAKNNDNTLGSHPFEGAAYLTITGKDYSSGAGLTYPYFVFHTTTVGQDIGAACEGVGVDDFKVIAFRRDGVNVSAWNGDKVKTTDTMTTALWFENMGTPYIANWNMNGQIAYMIKYNGVLSDTEVENKIDELKQRFGL
jgi:hypothetical protein